MPALALAEALPDFGDARPRRETSPPDPFDLTAQTQEGMPEAISATHGPTLEEEAAAANEGLRAELEARHAEAMEALRREHAAQQAEMETRLGAELGERLAGRLAEAEQRLLDTTSIAVSRILGLVLTEKLEERAVAALSSAITRAVADSDALRIVVHGPSHLFEAVKGAFGERADRLEFHESDDLDLTVSIDENVFATRISEWSSALTEVLA